MNDTAAANDDAHRILLLQIADGDEEALAELYRLFERRIYAFASSRLSDPAVAADLVNEVMMEVWRKADSFEGRALVSTWILGITRHRVLDELRRRGRRRFDELDPEAPEDEVPSAEDAMSGASDAAHLAYCLDQLPEAQREAVHLAFFEDLPYGEIAELAECPPGTVKTRVYHAKQALKRCLARRMRLGGAGDEDA